MRSLLHPVRSRIDKIIKAISAVDSNLYISVLLDISGHPVNLILKIVAVYTEAGVGRACTGMTLITEISVITVPWTLAVKKHHISGMNAGVGPPDTIKVIMASTPGAGWIR